MKEALNKKANNYIQLKATMGKIEENKINEMGCNGLKTGQPKVFQSASLSFVTNLKLDRLIRLLRSCELI